MKQLRPTHVQIDLKQLIANFQFLKNPGNIQNNNPFLCPMIKANAYGHGDKRVAQTLALEGCGFLGVSSVEEALGLGTLPTSTRILSFGFSGAEAVEELLTHNITPVVSDFTQLRHLVEKVKTVTQIHIKFNTGMNRLGFDSKDSPGILDLLSRNPGIQIEGLCTHLHSAEDMVMTPSFSCSDEDFSQERGFSPKSLTGVSPKLSATKTPFSKIYEKCGLEVFRNIQSHFGHIPFHHVFNSAAMVALHRQGFPLVFGSRPGLLVYGIDPGENLSFKPLVGPVMEFKSKIVSLRQVKSGDVVSYGGTWKADQDSLIGIVPAGYADGIPVGLSNKGEVLVKQKRIPIRGRVTMDYTMIDLTELPWSPENLIGEEVIFIGCQGDEQITVEEMAKTSACLSYEIMTGIGERVPRYYGVSK